MNKIIDIAIYAGVTITELAVIALLSILALNVCTRKLLFDYEFSFNMISIVSGCVGVIVFICNTAIMVVSLK